MNFEIKSMADRAIWSGDAGSLRGALEKACLENANLENANLRNANIEPIRADLYEVPREMLRVQDVIQVYGSLPGGAGMAAAMLMQRDIGIAIRAIAAGDVAAMIRIYNELVEWKL